MQCCAKKFSPFASRSLNMTCTGADAALMDMCQKIEHISTKYDKPFMDCLNRIMQFHVDWLDNGI